jgi:predicted NodU family carbamoyl transferase
MKAFFLMSLGSFYEAATEFCGFRPNYDEGKTMGLAPFGDPQVYGKEVGDIVHIAADGTIRVDLSYFNYQLWASSAARKSFTERSENHAFPKSRSRTTTTMSPLRSSMCWRSAR